MACLKKRVIYWAKLNQIKSNKTLQSSILQLKVDVVATTILDDYTICKAGGFSRSLLLCDVDDTLAFQTQQKLISLLNDLQQKVKCSCESGCQRPDGNDRYIGILLVTNSTKVANNDEALNETVKKIYYDMQLGNVHCDNGLLIIYIKDKKQLATYHGDDSYVFLDTKDLVKLHSLAIKNKSSDDIIALQYFLSNYNEAWKAETQRAETWTPIAGLFLALIIVLLILAILLTLFLARFCCCCARRIKDKDEMYQTDTVGGSRKILIATPTPERIYGTPGDAIYSTPYSGAGTPLPPPHLPGLKAEIYPGSLRSSSQTATPASIQKHRIRPLHSPIARGISPSSTLVIGRLNSNKVDDSTQTNGTATLDDILESKRAEPTSQGSASLKSGGNVLLPRTTETSGSCQRSIGYTESDLSFLDPRRKQEVQTCTDFIY
uniref:VWFA domain-containing protein n=1 Tax=Elaeophora elaphi TaxID=1147741 RepID=A0A0R3RKL5_9BILA